MCTKSTASVTVAITAMTDPEGFYRQDLASTHDEGFTVAAQNAAIKTLEELIRLGLTEGTVADLGCGSGTLLASMDEAGYGVFGVDISEDMIDLARKRVPAGSFVVDSILSVDLPECLAVTATAEVLNYMVDEHNGPAARAELFQRIYEALVPDGFFLFDVAGPIRAPEAGSVLGFSEGPGWAVLLKLEGDETQRNLTHHITSFRQVGELYRRDYEVHRQQLVEPEEIVDSLSKAGFKTELLTNYGDMVLPDGLVGFLASK